MARLAKRINEDRELMQAAIRSLRRVAAQRIDAIDKAEAEREAEAAEACESPDDITAYLPSREAPEVRRGLIQDTHPEFAAAKAREVHRW
jgi:DNA-nicking Smr family endonuclease